MKSHSPNSAIGLKSNSFFRNNPEHPIKVAIVDDAENDRHIMRQAVERSGEFICVGAYRSANEALAEIPKLRPHVVLMDIRMPGMDGHECTRRLKVIMPELKIIIITELLDVETMDKSLQSGADGYLTKPASAAQFLAMLKLTLRTGAQGRTESNALEHNSLLTAREAEIMALLADGFINKEIADKLGISCATVHFHLHNIFPKFAASNRIEAVTRWRNANRE